jgi:integrase
MAGRPGVQGGRAPCPRPAHHAPHVASTADDQDVPHRKIADMMDHRDIRTFQRVYRHKLRPVVTDTADLMDRIWRED